MTKYFYVVTLLFDQDGYADIITSIFVAKKVRSRLDLRVTKYFYLVTLFATFVKLCVSLLMSVVIVVYNLLNL